MTWRRLASFFYRRSESNVASEGIGVNGVNVVNGVNADDARRKGAIFGGGSAPRKGEKTAVTRRTPPVGVTLLDLAVGESATITTVRTGNEFLEPLMGMGVFAGSTVTILQGGGGKPLLLSVGETRIAIGRDLAGLIFVERNR